MEEGRGRGEVGGSLAPRVAVDSHFGGEKHFLNDSSECSHQMRKTRVRQSREDSKS